MILDSLLYWYYEIGVDGFRFDLSPVLGRDSDGQWLQHSLLKDLVEHPILSHALLISESWDLGGYFVGALPSGWSEWNDSYRDTVRKFIRGDFGQIPDLIKRIFGSVDLFHANRKNINRASILLPVMTASRCGIYSAIIGSIILQTENKIETAAMKIILTIMEKREKPIIRLS